MEDSSIVLIGGDELFFNARFIQHYKFMVNDYVPRIDRPIAFFLSCSKYKPFYKSPYRRIFNSMIYQMEIREISQIYTVSEPAIIIPEEYDTTEVTKYDFPPEKLEIKGKQIFIERLSQVLPKLLIAHKYNFYILPRHHKEIFEEAIKTIEKSIDATVYDMKKIYNKLSYAPPLIYNLPKARERISDILLARLDIKTKKLHEQ